MIAEHQNPKKINSKDYTIGQLDKTKIFTTPLSTYMKMIDAEESKEPNEKSGSTNEKSGSTKGRSDWLSVKGWVYGSTIVGVSLFLYIMYNP